jgi:hypothetical protein
MDNRIYTQGSLFRLPYLCEDDMRNVITPYHPFLWSVVMEPWTDLLARRADDRAFTDLTEEEMAIWLTMRAGKMAQAIFHGREGIEVRLWHRKPVIVIPDALVIIIKKLTKRKINGGEKKELTRSNFTTHRNVRVHNQQPVYDLPDVPRVVLGYELLEEATDIKLFIAYPRTKGKGFDWVYRLPEPMAATPEFPKLRVLADSGDTTEQKRFVIGPADDVERKEGGRE